jgi:hypothetical protein
MDKDKVIIELSSKEIFVVSSLMYLWRALANNPVALDVMFHSSDGLTKKVIGEIVALDLDGSFNDAVDKYKSAAIAIADDGRNV